MTRKNRDFLFNASLFLFFLCGATGCDPIYRLLQKEGAEEKDLLGEVIPFESNPKVEEVQKLLKLYGYGMGAVDGKLGLNTRRAIERFQQDNNLKVSRFVDHATWERLTRLSRSGLVVHRGVNISKVQMALTQAGFNPGKIDGRFGKNTRTALQAFQKANGLKDDGKIGFRTLSKLEAYLPVIDLLYY